MESRPKRSLLRGLVSGLAFYLVIFPVVLIWVGLTETHFSWVEVIAIELMFGLYIGLGALLVGIPGWLCTKKPAFDKLMSFGGAVEFWLFLMIEIVAKLGLYKP
jgi:hypothetical protein